MSRHTNKGIIFLTESSKYDSIRCKGDVRAEGRISADSINIKGSLSADNDITAASSFDFKGRISAGNISAQDVKIITGSDGTAGSITGGKVFIRCGIDPETKKEFLNITEFILNLFHVDGSRIRQAAEKADSEKNESPVFTCDEISGEDIELYGVTCKSVSGKNITLKGKCRADRVICSGKLEAGKHPHAVMRGLSVKFGTRPKRLDSLTTAPEYPYSPGRAYLWYKVPRLYPVELESSSDYFLMPICSAAACLTIFMRPTQR